MLPTDLHIVKTNYFQKAPGKKSVTEKIDKRTFLMYSINPHRDLSISNKFKLKLV